MSSARLPPLSLSYGRNTKRSFDQTIDPDKDNPSRPQRRYKKARRIRQSQYLTPNPSRSPTSRQTPISLTPAAEQASDPPTERNITTLLLPFAVAAARNPLELDKPLPSTPLDPVLHETVRSTTEDCLPIQNRQYLPPIHPQPSLHQVPQSATVGYLPTQKRQCLLSAQPEPSSNKVVQSVPSPPSSPPRTPYEYVCLDVVDEDFGRKVSSQYFISVTRDGYRANKYGAEVAQQWKRGSTPEEAREEYKAKIKRQEEAFNEYSDTESDEERPP
ncbi:MAG: hypothetical protein Q9196_000253 [Gyalolechia fulgens]